MQNSYHHSSALSTTIVCITKSLIFRPQLLVLNSAGAEQQHRQRQRLRPRCCFPGGVNNSTGRDKDGGPVCLFSRGGLNNHAGGKKTETSRIVCRGGQNNSRGRNKVFTGGPNHSACFGSRCLPISCFSEKQRLRPHLLFSGVWSQPSHEICTRCSNTSPRNFQAQPLHVTRSCDQNHFKARCCRRGLSLRF